VDLYSALSWTHI